MAVFSRLIPSVVTAFGVQSGTLRLSPTPSLIELTLEQSLPSSSYPSKMKSTMTSAEHLASSQLPLYLFITRL